MTRYPFAPLASAMGCSENQAVIRLGISGKQGQEYRHRGLTEKAADRLAVRAGLHPANVWPEWADAAEAAMPRCDRCGTPYVPVRRKQRWCSPRCRLYNSQKEHQRRRWANDPEWVEQQRERLRRYRAETAEYQRAQAKVRYQRRKAVA